tara:strand:- start:60 stop:377 length:318 start_codon:yes stop_codon:yes gene_type:complete
MTWLKTWWPVVTGVVVFVGWLVTGSMELGALRADTEHKHESAKAERVDLKEEDVRIHEKIKRTDKKLNKLKSKVDTTSETVVRIETNQSVIIRNQERIMNKLESR